jgi:hypothetical protein
MARPGARFKLAQLLGLDEGDPELLFAQYFLNLDALVVLRDVLREAAIGADRRVLASLLLHGQAEDLFPRLYISVVEKERPLAAIVDDQNAPIAVLDADAQAFKRGVRESEGHGLVAALVECSIHVLQGRDTPAAGERTWITCAMSVQDGPVRLEK